MARLAARRGAEARLRHQPSAPPAVPGVLFSCSNRGRVPRGWGGKPSLLLGRGGGTTRTFWKRRLFRISSCFAGAWAITFQDHKQLMCRVQFW